MVDELGAGVLLRVRERACVGGYYAHVSYGVMGCRCCGGASGILDLFGAARGSRISNVQFVG